ncbi:MAG: S1 family peptidase [Bdellovibrionia bacterium]
MKSISILKHKRRWMAPVITLMSLCSCAPQEPGSHLVAQSRSIIGGNLVTEDSEIASSAVVINIDHGKSMCSGTLIGDHLVLTAAHCVLEAESLHLYFGNVLVDLKGATPFQNYRAEASVEKVVVHENYSIQHYRGLNDIALITFKQSLPQGLKPAALAPSSLSHDNALLSKTALVAGFGLTKDTRKPTGSQNLSQVELKINLFEKNSIVELIKPEFKTQAVCSGDSGGPAYLSIDGKLYLWGVNSRGDCEKYSYITLASDFQDWISEKSRELEIK